MILLKYLYLAMEACYLVCIGSEFHFVFFIYESKRASFSLSQKSTDDTRDAVCSLQLKFKRIKKVTFCCSESSGVDRQIRNSCHHARNVKSHLKFWGLNRDVIFD